MSDIFYYLCADMRRFFAILTLIAVCFTASAQVEHFIVIDSNSFRAVQTDALTGVNIDPIGMDSSRQLCARVKIFFHRMTREQMEQLEPVFPSGTIDRTKCKVAEGNTVLILEFTAKPSTKFYLNHPTFGVSNEVEFDFEGGREYQLEASLNQTFSIVVNSNKPNVDIYLDNRYSGQTDASNSLTIKDVMIGGHKLKVTYGSVSYEQEIDVNSGSISFRQDVNKEAGEPQFVVFTVEPQSAVVTIGGKHYTLTDGAMRTVLNSGTYNYTVSAVGYHSKSDSFTVAGEKVTRNITLTADAATVTLTVADNAEIWVNGEKKGSGRWSGMLNSGPYIFEAKKVGYKSSTISKQISSAQPNQSFTLPAPTPIVGSIMVDGNPINADVALDGKPVGQVPLKLNNILIGKHTITISKSGYQPYTTTVAVAEGMTATLDVNLTKSTTQDPILAIIDKITPKEPIIIDTSNIGYVVNSQNRIDISKDLCRRPCARIKFICDQMTQDQIGKLSVVSSSADTLIAKMVVEPNSNILVVELTAKPNTTFQLHHPSWGKSNRVTIDLEPYGEYTLKVVRNTSTTAPSQNISSTPAPTPIFGSLIISGTPINADVTIDGKAVGQLPLKLGDILVGVHTVVVSKSGYETYTQSVTITDGKTITVNVALKKQITSPLKGVTPIEIDSSLTAEQLLTEGNKYYNKKDYNSAVQYYHKAAEQGNAKAQNNLGFCYESGRGVTQDYTETVKWYRKAAELGYAKAQNNLGNCYYKGNGVTQNYTEAVKWYRKAAEQGNAKAQNNLGLCYEKGRGVTKSISEAVKWYRKAAEKGHARAKENLRSLGY